MISSRVSPAAECVPWCYGSKTCPCKDRFSPNNLYGQMSTQLIQKLHKIWQNWNLGHCQVSTCWCLKILLHTWLYLVRQYFCQGSHSLPPSVWVNNSLYQKLIFANCILDGSNWNGIPHQLSNKLRITMVPYETVGRQDLQGQLVMNRLLTSSCLQMHIVWVFQ